MVYIFFIILASNTIKFQLALARCRRWSLDHHLMMQPMDGMHPLHLLTWGQALQQRCGKREHVKTGSGKNGTLMLILWTVHHLCAVWGFSIFL